MENSNISAKVRLTLTVTHDDELKIVKFVGLRVSCIADLKEEKK